MKIKLQSKDQAKIAKIAKYMKKTNNKQIID